MVNQQKNIKRMFEIVEIIRNRVSDIEIRPMIEELLKLSKPEKQYELTQKWIKQYTKENIDIEIKEHGEMSEYFKQQFEKQLQKDLKKEKSNANHSLYESICSDVKNLYSTRGESCINDTVPDYSNLFKNTEEFIKMFYESSENKNPTTNSIKIAVEADNEKHKILIFASYSCTQCMRFQKPETKKFLKLKLNTKQADLIELYYGEPGTEEYFKRFNVRTFPHIAILDATGECYTERSSYMTSQEMIDTVNARIAATQEMR